MPLPPSQLRFIRSFDGLRLAVEDCGPRVGGAGHPLLCLAGLTRTMRDFHALRDHFALHPDRPRRVVLMDTRGRGRSDYAARADAYTVQAEAHDAAQVASALGLGEAVLIGTSRGGMLAMTLALTRPGLIAGSVLNDIGPRIAGPGLARLKRQLQSSRSPADWEDAAQLVRDGLGVQFPAFNTDDWEAYARRTFADLDGKPVSDFDPTIVAPLSALPDGLPFIDLGQFFNALVTRPTLLVRGTCSDLLDQSTYDDAKAMGASGHLVDGQGHAPSLEGDTLDAIGAFLTANGL